METIVFGKKIDAVLHVYGEEALEKNYEAQTKRGETILAWAVEIDGRTVEKTELLEKNSAKQIIEMYYEI